MTARKQFATFFLDGLFFGVPVEKVQEVLRFHEMTRVPLAPPVVSGLINLRGQIVTALDLRRRLDLRERTVDEQPMNIVIRTASGAVSLLVDEIGDVVEAEAESFEIPPGTLTAGARDLIEGVYKLEDRLMHVLDTDKAVDEAVGPRAQA